MILWPFIYSEGEDSSHMFFFLNKTKQKTARTTSALRRETWPGSRFPVSGSFPKWVDPESTDSFSARDRKRDCERGGNTKIRPI